MTAKRKTFAIVLAIILVLVLGLLLGPCFVTANPPTPERPDEPASADETGGTTP